MNWIHIYAIYLRQLLLISHNLTRVFNIFIWIGVDIVLWGLIGNYFNSIGNTGFNLVTSILGAVVLWNFMVRVQQGVMLAFFEDVWSRNFINLFSSPLKIKEYFAGLVLTGVTTSLAGLLFMLLLAGVFYGYNIIALGLYIIPFMLILFLFGLSLGIIAMGMVLRFGPSAEWLAWPIPFFLGPLMCVFYPLSALPTFVQPFSYLLAPTYAFEGIRSVLQTGSASIEGLLIGLALSLVYLFLCYLLF